MAAQSMRIAVLLSIISRICALPTHNPLILGQTFIAGSTNPTGGSTGWSLVSHGIAEKLFTVDSTGAIVPQIAASTAKVETLKWTVTLKADYKFSDGTVVTAQHVADCLNELNSLNDNAKASLGTMTVTALDNSRVQIVSTQEHSAMDAVLAEFVFTIYLKKNNEYFFTGPYVVSSFVAGGDKISLSPNQYYPGASERPLHEIKKFADGQSLSNALADGVLDMAYHLPVGELDRLRAITGITIKSFDVGYQYMMFHNIARAALSDVKVRKALDLALDRNQLTQALQGGDGTRSFFPEGTPYYQAQADTQAHGDITQAKSLLDEAGWVLNANGKREKAGNVLTLKLVAYPQRPGLVTMQPVIKQTFENLGIVVTSVTTDGSSWDELDAIMASKDWDLLEWAQHTLPAGDPQWFINAFFRTGAGNNHASLASTEVDNLIDALAVAAAGADRVAATSAVHAKILEQVPVSILCSPAWHIGLRSRMSSYTPWGSDYYIVHDDTVDLMTQIPNSPSDPVSSTIRPEMLMNLIASFVFLAWNF
jgi:peptide/nickel transport system substrate-binding protein